MLDGKHKRKLNKCIAVLAFIFTVPIFCFSSVIYVKQYSDLKGNSVKTFHNISDAALVAHPGDTILVFSGIYREWVAPARSGNPDKPIVYKAAPGEKVVIKGSEIWTNEWTNIENNKNVYSGKLNLQSFENYNPFYIPVRRMEGRNSLGQIFVNGERYIQVDSLQQLNSSHGTWMLSYDSLNIILHYKNIAGNIPFSLCEVEYTARERVFSPHKRGLGYIHVEGFTIEHCANQFPSGFYHLRGAPQVGAFSTRAGHHWVIKNNIIRFAKTLAIDCGYGGHLDMEDPDNPWPPYDSIGYHLIENNQISDCGAGGIAGAYQRESIIRNNTIERCNYLGFTAPETGGIKVHFFYNGLIEGNLLRDNDCKGIWLDNQWYGSRVTRNTLINCSGQGIFVEMGNGPCMVDNNIVAMTQSGDGIYLHDASGVTIAHNLLYGNEHFGIYARIVTERMAGNYFGEKEMVGTFDLNIKNNIFIDNYRGHICLPLEDGKRVYNNKSDYNLFIGGTQWQWEGLGFNSFTIGTNDKRIPPDTLAEAMKNAFDKYNYPDSLRPNLNVWKHQPLLTFEWWKMLTGNDLNSVAPEIHSGEIEVGAIAKGAFNFSPYNLYIEVRNGESYQLLKAPKIAGIENDYYGQSLNTDLVYPGPFSSYFDGYNKFILK